MAEPNPLWGVHLAAGGLTAALVRRRDDGSLQILERVVRRVAGGVAPVLGAAGAFLASPGVCGRAAFIALPDENGCLVTAKLPPEDASLSPDDLGRELLDYTPFDPGDADLRFRLVANEGRSNHFAVAALPIEDLHGAVTALGGVDLSLMGLGFAGATLVRGARAVGLVDGESFLLEILPGRSFVYAVDGEHTHRYPVPFGENLLIRGAAERAGTTREQVRSALDADSPPTGSVATALAEVCAPLAEDVRRIISYHHEQHLRVPDADDTDSARLRVVLVGQIAAAPALRSVLHTALGDLLRTPATGEPTDRIVDERGDPVSADDAADLAGALGAAAEALLDDGVRIALRDPPVEVPEYVEVVEKGGRAGFKALLGAGVVAAAVVFALRADRDEADVKAPGSTPDSVADGQGDPAGTLSSAQCDHVHAALEARWRVSEGVRVSAGVLAAVPGLTGFGLEVRDTGACTLSIRSDDPNLEQTVRENAPDGVEVQAAVGQVSLRFQAPPPPNQGGAKMSRNTLERAYEALQVGADQPGDATERALTESRASLESDRGQPDGSSSSPGTRGRVRETLLRALCTAPVFGMTTLSLRVYDASGGRPDELSVQTAPRPDWLSELPPSAQATLPDDRGRRLAFLLDGLDPGPFDLRIVGPGTDAGSDTAMGLVMDVVVDPTAGGVRIRWPAGTAGRVVERAPIGPDGAAGAWELVATSSVEPGGTVDEVAPGSGRYQWRMRAPHASAAAVTSGPLDVVVPVEIEFAGPGASEGTGDFVLRRPWNGAVIETRVEVASGEPIIGRARSRDGTVVSLGSGWTLLGLERRTQTEQRTVQVPRFTEDGGIRRDEGGEPVLGDRSIEALVEVVEARARDGGGAARTWTQKMTDR